MQRIILFIITSLLFTSCCEPVNSSINYDISFTNTYKRVQVKDEYRVFGYNDDIRFYIFEIENHEYVGNPYSDTFIHSPNCKCHKESESCTSLDLLSQPSWF